jgi:DNA-binding NtrC family response regulator/tetratricopeptide (TPR) repeat protein
VAPEEAKPGQSIGPSDQNQGRNFILRDAPKDELEEIHKLLDQGLSSKVDTRLRALIKSARSNPSLIAKARCALSRSLEMQGRYRESLEAVEIYETPESRTGLNLEAASCIRVQIGLAYNYTGDHPKAIALLNSALREANDHSSDTQIGWVYAALARVYRSLNEYTIARDHAQNALEHFRHTGDWRGLAESYFGIGLAELFEGNYEQSLDHLHQALNLIGDHPAPYLQGKIYTNLAGACWFLKRPQEGVSYLEKSIGYYERTEHKANATDGYNNLGSTLILVGDWDRAQKALERALALASEMDDRGAKIPMILDSLAELLMLRGDPNAARNYLDRAVRISQEHGNKWYAWQPVRTLARYHLMMNEARLAVEQAQHALDLGEAIGDRQAICESRLLLAEANLACDDIAGCVAQLKLVTGAPSDPTSNLAVSGDAQRLRGMLALEQGDGTRAAHHFGRSISIFEMLGDSYRGALSHYWLGRAYALNQPERAAEHFELALRVFRKLGAHFDIERTEAALGSIEEAAPERQLIVAGVLQLLTIRLAEAIASRELLLRELAAVIREETNATGVMIVDPGSHDKHGVLVGYGWTEAERAEIAAALAAVNTEADQDDVIAKRDASITRLVPPNALPATLIIAPREEIKLPCGLSLDSLLRVVELGLDSCALRERERLHEVAERTHTGGQSLLPGFIHTSSAMTQLVQEILKIRSSDVTVLVTGESGTGKELVARAIHANSSRRSKAFVPFNCTAVPKELSDAYLFGYKRGSFTGAVADSPGVIRAASGGTLFLDEVGDLPLEIQPKLLRFLQEGEIQPLGDQRPVKVDVRIIAATNADPEEMVAAGKFREDLYYRLNVIRLRVPPLRERRSEIPAIVDYYINYYSQKFGRRNLQVSPQTIDLLMVNDWPGNVRQLTNEIQRIIARAEDDTLITPDDLSAELKHTAVPLAPSMSAQLSAKGTEAFAFWEDLTLPEAVDFLERLMIAEALRRHKGNVSRAARELNLTRRGLQLKLGRYRLPPSEERPAA